MGFFDFFSMQRRREKAKARRSAALLELERERLLCDEYRLDYESRNNALTKPFARLSTAVEERIPPGLQSTLDKLFYQAFRLLFERGSPVIERTYSTRSLRDDHQYRRLVYRNRPTVGTLRAVDRRAEGIVSRGTAFAAAEGVLLGAFGCGLPDIPLFISVLLRQLYRIALSYGFPCHSDEERAYVLTLITAALSDGEEREQASRHLDWLAERIDTGEAFAPDLEGKMRMASAKLSTAMLTAKFIQGTMFIGAAGGLMNLAYFKQIASYARVRYKKRFLLEEQRKLGQE